MHTEKDNCPVNLSFLRPYFENYEEELKELVVDLDQLIEMKKNEWFLKMRATEQKLAEEQRLHSEAKSKIVSKEKELAILAEKAILLEQRRGLSMPEYEKQVALLQNSSNVMSEKLSKLQLKYNRWRSRSAVPSGQRKDAEAYANITVEESAQNVAHRELEARCEELQSLLSTKASDILDNKNKIHSLELAFKAQVDDIERQLRSLISMKHRQDDDIRFLKSQKKPPATRNFRLQWDPSKSGHCSSDACVQANIIPACISSSTLTNPKYIGPSEAHLTVSRLEAELAQKQKHIEDLEESCSSACDVINKLKEELETTKSSLAEKCVELSQSKPPPSKLRRKQGFRSRFCQTTAVDHCNQYVDARVTETNDIESQTEDIGSGLPFGPFPGFLTDALKNLNQDNVHDQYPARTVPNKCSRGSSPEKMPYFDDAFHQLQAEVDVSINEAYGSHLKHNEDLQMEAFLANWQMEEDVADEHLLEGDSVSPAWLTVVTTTTAGNNDFTTADQQQPPADYSVVIVSPPPPTVAAQNIAPLTSSSTTIATVSCSIGESERAVVFPTLCSPSTGMDPSDGYNAIGIKSSSASSVDDRVGAIGNLVVPRARMAVAASNDYHYHNSYTRSTPIESLGPFPRGGVPPPAQKANRQQPETGMSDSVNVAGDVWEGGSAIVSHDTVGMNTKDSFFGLEQPNWSEGDIAVDQLAVQFLASERQHSARLECMIDAHLQSLRLEADLGPTTSRTPILPTMFGQGG